MAKFVVVDKQPPIVLDFTDADGDKVELTLTRWSADKTIKAMFNTDSDEIKKALEEGSENANYKGLKQLSKGVIGWKGFFQADEKGTVSDLPFNEENSILVMGSLALVDEDFFLKVIGVLQGTTQKK